MNNTQFILVNLGVYLTAAVPTGVILAKIMGYEDVRGKGSGNIGATNVYRVAGKVPGIFTLLGDILKGLLPIFLIQKFLDPTESQLAVAGATAIIGHCYPIYLSFKGGKGVATALGIFIVLAPKAVIYAAVIFILTVAFTRFISLGSILAAAAIPLLALLFGQPQAIFISALFISLLVIWRHRTNIARLLDGSENRFKG